MAKGLRSKVKRANRTAMRKTRVEPAIAKRTETLNRIIQRSVVEKKDASGLASLIAKPFQQGFKSGFKKPEYNLGADEDLRNSTPSVVPEPIAGGTRNHAVGAFVANYDYEAAEKEKLTRRGGRRASTNKELVWFSAPAAEKIGVAAAPPKRRQAKGKAKK